MPPHCDTRDGPVVKAAMRALETGDPAYLLIWVPEESERELRGVFARVIDARRAGGAAQEVADDWLFETAVRLHRAGERAPYTGLKPAGLDEGPVVPRAEKAIAKGDPSELIRFLTDVVRDDLEHRFHRVRETKDYDPDDIPAGREYLQAFIGFVVYSHHLYEYVKSGGGHGGTAGSHH
ncbi:MAG: DUF6448 family protein [Methanomicrobiales archaeon]|nr:DUF6448 family protein [Methanomicrobiales archaeon]